MNRLLVTASTVALFACTMPAVAANPASTPPATTNPEAGMWDLSDLYPSAEAWSAARDKQKAAAAELERYKGTLGKNAESMLAALSKVLRVEREPSRVLLVEDDADLAKVILATFERAGIQVHHASTQRKAMELCVSSRPDLVILDIALPDGDGFGLVDWLRQQQDMKNLPLVVYSAQDLSEGERKKLRLGNTEFLTKARVQPQDVETLVLSMLRQPNDATEVPLGWDGTASPSV